MLIFVSITPKSLSLYQSLFCLVHKTALQSSLSLCAFHRFPQQTGCKLPVEKLSVSLPRLWERNRWGLEGMKEIRDERISPKMGTERVRQRERERERGGRGTGKPIGMENQVGVERQEWAQKAEDGKWWTGCGVNKNIVDSWRTSYHEVLSIGSNNHFGVIWHLKHFTLVLSHLSDVNTCRVVSKRRYCLVWWMLVRWGPVLWVWSWGVWIGFSEIMSWARLIRS